MGLHVRLKEIKEKDMLDMGICSPSTVELLKADRVFEVVERRQSGEGRKMVYLGKPFESSTLIWVYEDFVEYLHGSC